MTQNLQNRLIKFCFETMPVITGEKKHFTFILDNNKIVSVGWNDYIKTHPWCAKLGYGKKKLHSEVAAILPFRDNLSILKNLTLINIRVNTEGKILISKPCDICSSWIKLVGFKRIIYTNNDGKFISA